jgi:predicted RNA-binding protein with PUA-like domain
MKKSVQNTAKKAFKSLGDLRKDIVVKHKESEYFDPATGSSVTEWSEHSVKAIVTHFTRVELQSNSINPNDKKVSFLCDDLPVELSLNDKLVIDGSEKTIIHIKKDVSDSLYEVQV